MPLHIVDTAGLRESDDVIEQEGIRRAHSAIKQADVVLQVMDIQTDSPAEVSSSLNFSADIPMVQIFNKIDIESHQFEPIDDAVYVSAKTGEGFDQLIQTLKDIAGFQSDAANTLGARTRHLNALDLAKTHIDIAYQYLTTTREGELMAEELRIAQEHLNSITGEFSSDDLLGKIFGSFCIGK